MNYVGENKTIFSGLESSGKSLLLAMTAGALIYRNAQWFKKTGKMRPLVSCMTFSESFVELARELNVPIIYWIDVDDLIKYRDCDVIIDEVGNYFDSRFWQDLSIDVRKWLSQAAKMGVEIYGGAQDFAQVDIAFRRLTNKLYHVTKVIGSQRPTPTRPPVNTIWGLCMVRALDPRAYKEDKKKFESEFFLPSFFFIQRKYCEIFDTTQFMARGASSKLRHEEKTCMNPDCTFHKVVHI